jgi:hypothetical protein
VSTQVVGCVVVVGGATGTVVVEASWPGIVGVVITVLDVVADVVALTLARAVRGQRRKWALQVERQTVPIGRGEGILDGPGRHELGDDVRLAVLVTHVVDGDDVGWSPRAAMARASSRSAVSDAAPASGVRRMAIATSRPRRVSSPR